MQFLIAMTKTTANYYAVEAENEIEARTQITRRGKFVGNATAEESYAVGSFASREELLQHLSSIESIHRT